MDQSIEKEIQDRIGQLPTVVQDAIASADTTAHLRELSTTHQLHIDQWQILENQVMLTLLAFQEPEDLSKNIEEQVKVSHETANILAEDISRVIFEPIREELERQLDHPDAQAKSETGVEQVTREQLVASNAPAPSPLIPLPTKPETQAVRASLSDVYKAGEVSSARMEVHNDPYREMPT